MDAVTYPHPEVKKELRNWLEARVDVSRQAGVARLFGVAAVPVAIAVTAEGRILDRRVDFVEPKFFASWLREVRIQAR